MDVLCTNELWSGFGERLAAAAPDAGWLLMAPDGTVSRADDGAALSWEEAAPEVIVGSYDVFAQKGLLRPFFGFVAKSGSLRWFQSCSAGFETDLYGELLRRGVRISTGHGTASPIGEYVVWAVLDTFLGAGAWRDAQRGSRGLRGGGHREVDGSTWLVVGMGNIGTEVATRARALGARVIGVRRTPTGDEPVDRMVTPDGLAGELGGADVVVIAAPAGDSTRHLVDAAFLAAMAPDALLVNVARGELVDEAALIAALDAGRPGAAVLDVTSVEPLPADSPLWGHPKVTISPHTSGITNSTNGRLMTLVEDNLGRYLRGAPLRQERTLADWRA